MRKALVVLVLLSVWVVLSSEAQTPPTKVDEHSAHHVPGAPSGDAVEGEVHKIDKAAGKITLKHGPIPNLDMTAMTMVFRVKDPAMLDAVRVGDKVRFTADKIQGALTITEISALR